MKKIYLTTFSLLLTSALFGQLKIDASKATVAGAPEKVVTPNILSEAQEHSKSGTYNASPSRAFDRRALTYNYIRIGGTRYDLQTNASIGKRIILHSDGTVSAVFTTSTDNAFTNRGSGYNHFNGNDWANSGSGVSPRLEQSRTGWPSIGIIEGNKEFVIGHIASTGGFVMSVNSAIGDKNFASQTVILEEGSDRPIWGRAASDGQNHIHIICNYSDSLEPGQTRAPIINGVQSPTVYGRSANGGATWDAFGKVTNIGSNFLNGTYTNIPVINSGTNKNITANFTVENNEVASFEHNGSPSDFVIGDVLTIKGRSINVGVKLKAGNDTVFLDEPTDFFVVNSTVVGGVLGALDPQTTITSFVDENTFIISPPAVIDADDNLIITPPYGNGRFFTFTFNTNLRTLPGFDSSRWVSGSADRYAIDVKDSIVAIVTGGLATDVTMWKSTDNGVTFTQYIVDSFPYPAFEGDKVLAVDTPFCSDGTFDILIDNQGKVHLWYGVSRILNEVLEPGFSFYPTTAALAYWNESLTDAEVIATGSMLDRDGDGVLTLSPGTWSSLNADRNIPSNLFSVARLTNTSLLRQPSAGIDNQDRLFVTFSLPIEGAVDPNDVNYRDIYMMYSIDGGSTWGAPQNVTQKINRESDFASIARDVNDFVHIVLQEDDIPGNNLTNNSASSNNHPIPEEGNDIMYAAIPADDICEGNIGNLFGLNVKDVTAPSKVFVVSQNVPNPFSNVTDVTIYLNNYTHNLSVNVVDMMGKNVFSSNLNNLNPGNHIISIDGSSLSSGIYFYSITSGKNTITRKMIVE